MASSFNGAISLMSALISDLKAAISDHLASGQSGELCMRWEELLELHEHACLVASGGSYGLLGISKPDHKII
jgi:Ran GTPase-activating protein (RanGAP) involved in mRNA processing and transport